MAPYIHPTYLASLGDQLTILVSHGHDDHFDDKLLEIFSKGTKFVTANFKSPSVINRLKRLGFENILTVGEDEQFIDDLIISSYVVSDFSHDDATYLIRNDKGAVIHANDNWHEFTEPHSQLIKERIAGYSKSSVLLFSQTNSASGYPLNYRNFKPDQKQKILKEKVSKMVAGGLKNAESLGLDRMFSYAGFATVYVKGKNYNSEGLFPTGKYLKQLLMDQSIESTVEIPDLFPGDSVSLPSGEIIKAFVNGYQDSHIKTVTDKFYDVYGVKNHCISYRQLDNAIPKFEPWIEYFLTELDIFARKRVDGMDSHYTKLIGKELSMQVTLNNEDVIYKTIRFGEGLVPWNAKANKVCHVGEFVLFAILKGEALFEDLDTGYNAEWERFPEKEYNRDIVMMIGMFSYVYKNRLSSNARKTFLAEDE